MTDPKPTPSMRRMMERLHRRPVLTMALLGSGGTSRATLTKLIALNWAELCDHPSVVISEGKPAQAAPAHGGGARRARRRLAAPTPTADPRGAPCKGRPSCFAPCPLSPVPPGPVSRVPPGPVAGAERREAPAGHGHGPPAYTGAATNPRLSRVVSGTEP
jgi:hypothetical protein